MAGRFPLESHASRRTPLAACVASIFTLCAPAVALAETWTVLNCDGDAVTGDIGLKTGALRFAVANAADGDTVDLSKLNCPNSTISLTTGGYIAVPQPSLTIKGAAASVMTIDGSALPGGPVAYSNLFYHTGNGTLTIQDLALTGGHVNHQYLDAKGGCIYSKANVVLDHATVSSCSAHSDYASAMGGGVYAKGNLDVKYSTLSGNSATAGGIAQGGGASTRGNLNLELSALSGNTANGKSSLGGGAYTIGDFYSGYSTISDNKVYSPGYGGGLDLVGMTSTISSSTISGNISLAASGGVEVSSTGATFLISNSTVSGNHAELFTGGLRVDASIAKFYNSTIAFNTANFGGPTEAAGVQLQEDRNGAISVILESNVISNNTIGSNESDLGEFVPPGHSIEINGGLAAVPAHNLIRAASVTGLPTDTKTSCPLLGSLRDNGGFTKTHALSSHSPAIDAGNDYFLASYDQRGTAAVNGTIDYERVSGPAGDPNPQADIGAHEVQQDDIVFNTTFEGCD